MKVSYIGAPKVFALELLCQQLTDAFNCYGCYLVGSSLDKPDWRDVDVRMIMADEEFDSLFPDAGAESWEFDVRWLLMTVSISEYLSRRSGLPVDFQFQKQSHANKAHGDGKKRHCVGMKIRKQKEIAAKP